MENSEKYLESAFQNSRSQANKINNSIVKDFQAIRLTTLPQLFSFGKVMWRLTRREVSGISSNLYDIFATILEIEWNFNNMSIAMLIQYSEFHMWNCGLKYTTWRNNLFTSIVQHKYSLQFQLAQSVDISKDIGEFLVQYKLRTTTDSSDILFPIPMMVQTLSRDANRMLLTVINVT